VLDLNRLLDRKEELRELMVLGIVSLFAEDINPYNVLESMPPDSTTVVDIAAYTAGRAASTTITDRMRPNLPDELGERIRININRYNARAEDFARVSQKWGLPIPSPQSRMPNMRLQEVTERLADLFESCLS
jgi:hypothetical protein